MGESETSAPRILRRPYAPAPMEVANFTLVPGAAGTPKNTARERVEERSEEEQQSRQAEREVRISYTPSPSGRADGGRESATSIAVVKLNNDPRNALIPGPDP